MCTQDISFKNTSVILQMNDLNTMNIRYFEENCQQLGLTIRINENKEKGEFEIFNSYKLLFKEEQYINKVSYFKDVLRKFYRKDYDGTLYYVQNDFTLRPIKCSDKNIYSNVVEENNIDGLSKNDLVISVEMLENLEQQDDKICRLINIYILLFLSNKTIFDNENFTFSVILDNYNYTEIVQLNSVSFDLLPVYKWIVFNNEYKEAYKVKTDIVRKLIIEKKSFNLSEEDLLNCKSIFNRIIRNEVEVYFEQVRILKEDFINLQKSISNVKQSLHLKILTWLGSIGLVIFDYVKESNSKVLYYTIFFSHSEKVQIILLMLLIAFIVIFMVFIIEMNDLKSEYKKIKDYYTKDQFFIKKDFENYIKTPKINCIYKGIFIFGILIFVIRLFII